MNQLPPLNVEAAVFPAPPAILYIANPEVSIVKHTPTPPPHHSLIPAKHRLCPTNQFQIHNPNKKYTHFNSQTFRNGMIVLYVDCD